MYCRLRILYLDLEIDLDKATVDKQLGFVVAEDNQACISDATCPVLS